MDKDNLLFSTIVETSVIFALAFLFELLRLSFAVHFFYIGFYLSGKAIYNAVCLALDRKPPKS